MASGPSPAMLDTLRKLAEMHFDTAGSWSDEQLIDAFHDFQQFFESITCCELAGWEWSQ